MLKGVQGLARGMAAAGFLGAAGATMWQNRAFTAAAPVALSPSEFRSFKCVDIEKLTPNTFKYTFELPGGAVPGLTVASCLMCKTEIDGKEVARPYTPISGDEKPGAMDLVVKVYDQGKVSKAFGNMQVGDSMAMKGPFKKFEYKPNEKKEIGMIAGGSGITPMYQVIDAIMRNPADKTKVKLIFCNVSEEDIILKKQLDAWAKDARVTVNYVLDKPPPGWKGGSGYLNREMLGKMLPDPSPDNQLTGLLASLGYTKEMVFKF